MKDKGMFLNWIKAWAVGALVSAAGFAVVFWCYGLALRSYGLMEGGAL